MSVALFQPFPMLPARSAQVWRHQPEYQRPRHFHAEPEINLVVKGSARVGVGDRVLELGPRELAFFEPGQDHVLLDASPDLELFVAALRPALAERARGRAPRVLNDKVVLSESEVAELRARALALADVRDGSVVEHALAAFFEALNARPCTSRVHSRRVLAELRAELSLSASEVARRLHTAPAQVSRDVRADLGLTLVALRARLRLMHFVRLVDAGATLSRAALDADFGSYSQCHRTFQRLVGCSPRQYFGGRRRQVDAAIEPAHLPRGVKHPG